VPDIRVSTLAEPKTLVLSFHRVWNYRVPRLPVDGRYDPGKRWPRPLRYSRKCNRLNGAGYVWSIDFSICFFLMLIGVLPQCLSQESPLHAQLLKVELATFPVRKEHVLERVNCFRFRYIDHRVSGPIRLFKFLVQYIGPRDRHHRY
jgi:hypothetical protein